MLGAFGEGPTGLGVAVQRVGGRVVLDRAEDVHGQSPVKREHPPHLPQRSGPIGEELQPQLAEHDIERRIRERQGEGAAFVPLDRGARHWRERPSHL
jgi:hypothetical protein